ncbi:hypothetical protein SAMN05877809_105272 [Rhodobacter sp. JA431]|uniref:hypothetical protein n=1 Tax=Rhodobacter sp. JA431 TaxID=570013 RepID=UPI000BCCF66B|nr:hypothetical protein [Rhodobacter sp. JA431]SOC11382.1 hypothetical protein SAMN05877809_105272 [Rhodobacter sp. JA431]
MTGAASVKPLFQAMKPKRDARQAALADFAQMPRPKDVRDPLDFDPTPKDATRPFVAAELSHIRAHGRRVWETAVGAGHIAEVLAEFGFEVVGNDVVDRGWPGVELRSFFDVEEARAPIQITNPPYNQINASNGHGRWLRHAMQCGASYVALLLNADWPAARINGFDSLLYDHPPSIEYLCCWKIDFRGGGAPPQRNSWFVWDINRLPMGPNCWVRQRLYKDFQDPAQGVLGLDHIGSGV